MSIRFWTILVLFIAWSSISWKWYTCDIQGFCSDEQVAADENISSNTQESFEPPPPIWPKPITVKKLPVEEKIADEYLSDILPFHFTFMYNRPVSYFRQKDKKDLVDLCEHIASGGQHLTLTGHTDTMGEAGKVLLGLQRAEAVKKHLVECGCPENQIQLLSKGSSSPISGDATVNQRAKNRRVEISLSNLQN